MDTAQAPTARARPDPEAVHRSAVATTLSWADAAAGRGQHGDALAWLNAIEAIGDQLPPEYAAKRKTWLMIAAIDPVHS